jgi:hypothetical protein
MLTGCPRACGQCTKEGGGGFVTDTGGEEEATDAPDSVLQAVVGRDEISCQWRGDPHSRGPCEHVPLTHGYVGAYERFHLCAWRKECTGWRCAPLNVCENL